LPDCNQGLVSFEVEVLPVDISKCSHDSCCIFNAQLLLADSGALLTFGWGLYGQVSFFIWPLLFDQPNL